MALPSIRRSVRAPTGGLLALVASLSFAAVAHAAPKDSQGEKALREAMELDYLETRFADAEARLRAAIDACGADACGKNLKARLHIALGTVLAGGMNRLDDAKDAFVDALMIDLTVKPDVALAQTSISYAFDQARSELKLAATPADRIKVTPPPASQTYHPLPIYAELASELTSDAARISMTFAAPASSQWITVDLKKLRERGYGVEIPCHHLERTGPVRYYLVVTSSSGESLATAGSEAEPLETAIDDAAPGEPPRWPGFAPPGSCKKAAAAVEAQCVDERECNPGLACVAGHCVAQAKGAPGAQKNWVGVHFVPDTSIVSGDDVCTASGQEDDHFVCLRDDLSRYEGTPTIGNGNTVTGGWGLSTLRLVLSYDRLVLDNLTVGARLGFAFNGATDGGADFFPLHVEARGAYWFGKTPFETTGARPFVLVSGGIAQVDTKVKVQVLEDGVACGAKDPASSATECTRPSGGDRVEPRTQNLSAYKQAGLGFVGAGVGIAYAPIARLTLDLAVRASVTLPITTLVLSPEAGVSFGF